MACMGREGQGNLDGVNFVEIEWPKIFLNFFRTVHFFEKGDFSGFLLVRTSKRGRKLLWGKGKMGKNSLALGRLISTHF